VSIGGDAAVVGPDSIWLDDGGLLHVGTAWVALPDIEWRLVETLITNLGHVVPRSRLIATVWPDREVMPATLGVTIKRVRRRLAPLGLEITTVRGRGFVLSREGPTVDR
jgi:DNA-binding winged helix-turn-helix (wHTH) protein